MRDLSKSESSCYVPSLTFSYFHMAGVCQAQGQLESAREYAQKSLVLVEHNKLTDLREEVEALLRELKGVSGKE